MYMYVCSMSVHNGFTIKIYWFTIEIYWFMIEI